MNNKIIIGTMIFKLKICIKSNWRYCLIAKHSFPCSLAFIKYAFQRGSSIVMTVWVMAAFLAFSFFERPETTTMSRCTIGILAARTANWLCVDAFSMPEPNADEQYVSLKLMLVNKRLFDVYLNKIKQIRLYLLATWSRWTVWILATFSTP